VERADEVDRRAKALKRCLEKLPANQRALVAQRYAPDGSVQDIAAAAGRKVGAISQSLYRIREALLKCVEQTVAEGEIS
jgi:RNA polymerase sigma-70 factor (ECF subfamily)